MASKTLNLRYQTKYIRNRFIFAAVFSESFVSWVIAGHVWVRVFSECCYRGIWKQITQNNHYLQWKGNTDHINTSPWAQGWPQILPHSHCHTITSHRFSRYRKSLSVASHKPQTIWYTTTWLFFTCTLLEHETSFHWYQSVWFYLDTLRPAKKMAIFSLYFTQAQIGLSLITNRNVVLASVACISPQLFCASMIQS